MTGGKVMKKTLIMLVVAAALGAVAEDKGNADRNGDSQPDAEPDGG